LVAVALDDQAEQLIRVGKRFADALDAEWLVVSVETPAMLKVGEASRDRRVDILRLAESLGGQTVTLDGPSASAALAEYARFRNVTRIVVGEPRRFGLQSLLRPSTATKLVRGPRDSERTRYPEPTRNTCHSTGAIAPWACWPLNQRNGAACSYPSSAI
jgi:two-component system, OmpR family, sensor histidine kinase KdpD